MTDAFFGDTYLECSLGSIFNGWVVRKFVYSKPPGRKMITADINAIIFITGNVTVIINCVGIGLRTIFGPLPFLVIFLLNETMVNSFSLSVGVCNVVAFFHVMLIFHSRSVKFP